MLYLIPTPIGNLKDITLRALEVLQACDYILCEDTRHSQVLLTTFDIRKPLRSFHQYNENELEHRVIADLKNGLTIGLISDAGTPGICDPGEGLIRRCWAEKIPFDVLPGPSAFATALAIAPFRKDWVQFLGFVPKKAEERKRVLAAALSSPYTTVFYESPHRLVDTLAALPPDTQVCVIREISKKFEERLADSAAHLLHHFQINPPKGEFVILIEGSTLDWTSLPPQEHVKLLEKEYHLSQHDAIKIAAELRHVSKREIYTLFYKSSDVLE